MPNEAKQSQRLQDRFQRCLKPGLCSQEICHKKPGIIYVMQTQQRQHF